MKRGVLGRAAHRKLIEVRLPDKHSAGTFHAADHRGVVRRLEVLEHARRAGGPQATGAQDILDRHGKPRQRADRIAAATPLVDGSGLADREFRVGGEKGADRLVESLDTLNVGARELLAGALPALKKALPLRGASGDPSHGASSFSPWVDLSATLVSGSVRGGCRSPTGQCSPPCDAFGQSVEA
jgi:hypothetical protein